VHIIITITIISCLAHKISFRIAIEGDTRTTAEHTRPLRSYICS